MGMYKTDESITGFAHDNLLRGSDINTTKIKTSFRGYKDK
jgi:hypothetical protein